MELRKRRHGCISNQSRLTLLSEPMPVSRVRLEFEPQSRRDLPGRVRGGILPGLRVRISGSEQCDGCTHGREFSVIENVECLNASRHPVFTFHPKPDDFLQRDIPI